MPPSLPSTPTAVVTGAGSGVGRAIVQKLAAEGWRVALVGRRAEALAETIALATAANVSAAPGLTAFPCDIGNAQAVDQFATAVLARFGGRVDAFINAAGTNTPRRSWSELSLEAYHELLAGNLHGAFHGVKAFLPGMRERRAGTFVFINSEAGLKASAKSGVGYVAAKFGLTGLWVLIAFRQNVFRVLHEPGIRAFSLDELGNGFDGNSV